ncbi:MAG: dihydropyrimidine dehydrogenase, partial [bacterium (Candidatus Ratteibacteria) CG01_land_8_20_14_3_00_40_19]
MIEREVMPRQDPKVRIKNFNEVALGYSREQAVREASRCLQCKKPFCIEGCPVEIDIPKFIKEIKNSNFSQAIATLKEKNNLPGVCGRVCPQESQCEKLCILAKKGQPISIGRLERFA